jgi:hypothetical protein
MFLITIAVFLGLTALFCFVRAPARAPIQALTLTPTLFPVGFLYVLVPFPFVVPDF